METALVFGHEGETLAWHEPNGRHSGGLPDSAALWRFIEANIPNIGGVAHTHPWIGPARPSFTDVTTFRAIERGIGRVLVWPIFTFTDALYIQWDSEWYATEGNFRRIMPRRAVQDRDELLRRSR